MELVWWDGTSGVGVEGETLRSQMPRVGGWLSSGRKVALTNSPPPGPTHLLSEEPQWEVGGVTLCPLPPLEGAQADSLQALQALVHLQGLGQGLGTSITNAVTRKPAINGTWVNQPFGAARQGRAWGSGSRCGLSLLSGCPGHSFFCLRLVSRWPLQVTPCSL